MEKRKIRKIAAITVIGGIAFGGWLATRGGPSVDAIGGTWAVNDVVWHDTGGALRARVTFAPKSVQIVNAQKLDILDSLCVAALESPAALGRDDLQVSDIYRLDINALDDAGEPVFVDAIPVPVSGGTCQTDTFGDTFYPTYPAPLEGWYVQAAGLMNGGEQDVVHAVRFQSFEGTQVNLADFDIIAACQFVINDPGAWRLLDGQAPQDGQLRIEAREGVARGAVASAGLFFADVVTIVNGACMAEGGDA